MEGISTIFPSPKWYITITCLPLCNVIGSCAASFYFVCHICQFKPAYKNANWHNFCCIKMLVALQLIMKSFIFRPA